MEGNERVFGWHRRRSSLSALTPRKMKIAKVSLPGKPVNGDINQGPRGCKFCCLPLSYGFNT
ncbi:hypothetical protein QJS10_CPA05g00735 [Acorus calamus]|uniref:Uncharacterized protein n=1 Tax=Acorus calamus TaxID=4465 RepID=A0AAV9ERR2_ACOCL|nr:hypothetical protein QJS10_CPA05g00735 [Acorus calamus]